MARARLSAAARLSLAAAAFLLALAGAEALLRSGSGLLPRDARIIGLRRALRRGLTVPHPELRLVLAPRFERELSNGGTRLRVAHAPYPSCPEAGYRGAPEDALAPEIVVLGDSMTHGIEVDQDEVWPARLAALTGRRVLNMAATAHGGTQQRLLYERCAPRRARLTIAVPFVNDVADNVLYDAWRRSGGSDAGPGWCESVGARPGSVSCAALSRLSQLALGDLLVHTLNGRSRWLSRRPPAETERGLALLCEDLAALRDAAGRRGSRLAVVLPENWRMSPEDQRAGEALSACLRRLRLPALELGLERGRVVPPLRGRLDLHWNEAGHRRAAGRVRSFIEEEGLLR